MYEEEEMEECTAEPEIIQRVYIGPNLTYERLRTAQIITGTEQEIDEFMRPVFEAYPEAIHLLVSVDNLSEAMARVEDGNSVLHRYYTDMLAKSRENRYSPRQKG